MTASLKRRLKALEASKRSAGKRCVFCEQWYWTLVAPRTAIGPYSETEWGNEAGLAVARAPRDAHFEVTHAGVEAAMREVEQTRPRNPRCERCGVWDALVNREAGVLLDYPVVADAVAEAYKEYAKTPLETRCLYFSLSRKEVA